MARFTRDWFRKQWKETVRPILVVVIVLCTFRSAVADWNDVPTGSMKPTIVEGDRIVVNKMAYDFRLPFTGVRLIERNGPDRGDVVILLSPTDGTRMVKRVVGLPGETLQILNNRVYIDGKPVTCDMDDQPARRGQAPTSVRWLGDETLGERHHAIMISPAIPARRTVAPIVIPDDHYFVMGDNRDQSKDSRYFGTVPRDRIVGEAIGIAFSLDASRYYLPRWSRFFHELP